MFVKSSLNCTNADKKGTALGGLIIKVVSGFYCIIVTNNFSLALFRLFSIQPKPHLPSLLYHRLMRITNPAVVLLSDVCYTQ